MYSTKTATKSKGPTVFLGPASSCPCCTNCLPKKFNPQNTFCNTTDCDSAILQKFCPLLPLPPPNIPPHYIVISAAQ